MQNWTILKRHTANTYLGLKKLGEKIKRFVKHILCFVQKSEFSKYVFFWKYLQYNESKYFCKEGLIEMKKFIASILIFAAAVGMGNGLTYANTIDEIEPESAKLDVAAETMVGGKAWDVTKCAASISAVLVSVALPVAHIVKIKQAIKIAGGLRIFAELVVAVIFGTKSFASITIALGPVVGEAIAIVLGIDGIITNCSGLF